MIAFVTFFCLSIAVVLSQSGHFAHTDNVKFNYNLYGVSRTIEFKISVENVDQWNTLKSAWKIAAGDNPKVAVTKIVKENSLYKSVLIAVLDEPVPTKLKLRFASRNANLHQCNQACLEHHARTFLTFLMAQPNAPKISFEELKYGEPEFGFSPTAAVAFIEDINPYPDPTKLVAEKIEKVDGLILRMSVHNKLLQNQILLQIALQLRTIYQFRGNLLLGQMENLLFGDKFDDVGTAAYFPRVNHNSVMEMFTATQNRIKLLSTLFPNEHSSIRLTRSRRICNLTDSTSPHFLLNILRKLPYTAPPEEWRQLQDETSDVYKRYMNLALNEMSTIVQRQNIPRDVIKIKVQDFALGKLGELAASFLILVDGNYMEREKHISVYTGFNKKSIPAVIDVLFGAQSSNTGLLKMEAEFFQPYIGGEHCWLDETREPVTSPAPPATTTQKRNAAYQIKPASSTIVYIFGAATTLFLLR